MHREKLIRVSGQVEQGPLISPRVEPSRTQHTKTGPPAKILLDAGVYVGALVVVEQVN